MSILQAYASDAAISRAQLAEIPLPAAAGRFHRPVSFAEYVDEVEHQLGRHGLQMGRQEYLLSHENQRFFGLVEVEPAEGELITASEWKLLMGLRGSHDQAASRGIALGRQVLICSNLSWFSGDLYTSSTKQTLRIWDRLPQMVGNAVSHIAELAEAEQARVQRMQNFSMRPRWGDAALVEIHRRGGLSGPELGRAIREWDAPTYPEFAENGHTAWRLEQACTQAVKPVNGGRANMVTVQRRTSIASDFINEVMGV